MQQQAAALHRRFMPAMPCHLKLLRLRHDRAEPERSASHRPERFEEERISSKGHWWQLCYTPWKPNSVASIYCTAELMKLWLSTFRFC